MAGGAFARARAAIFAGEKAAGERAPGADAEAARAGGGRCSRSMARSTREYSSCRAMGPGMACAVASVAAVAAYQAGTFEKPK